jgi:hypothetical protein
MAPGPTATPLEDETSPLSNDVPPLMPVLPV